MNHSFDHVDEHDELNSLATKLWPSFVFDGSQSHRGLGQTCTAKVNGSLGCERETRRFETVLNHFSAHVLHNVLELINVLSRDLLQLSFPRRSNDLLSLRHLLYLLFLHPFGFARY